ncbi:MAG: ABC transporter substrate-binding protein [Pseudomonadota bacterium]|nr:ABC transporter substrate-binding protein [Pseudomonadota bacterium]
MKSIHIARRAGLIGALLALALALPVAVLAQNAVDSSTPQKLVETSARLLLADLDKNRAAYRKDITGLYKVIDTQFLPHVDVQFAAQQVLGKHWRTATAEQRKRFVDAFYRSMLTTYGNALLEFTADDLRIKPFRGDANAERASVDTEIKRSNGASVAVQYSLRKTPQGWKVWDVVIEGISYVKSFREDFGLEIDQKGLDALLARLESTKGATK